MNKYFQFLSPGKARFIFYKEMSSFLGSNLPPVSVGIITIWCGVICAILAGSPGANVNDITRALYWVMYIGFILCFGFLSMSAFVSERKQGTMELLYTLPVTDTELVVGKFLFGLFAVFFMTVLVSLFYFWGIAQAPWTLILTGSFGLFLAGLYVYSVGIFSSSLTDNYLLSLLYTALIVILIEVGGYMTGLLPSPVKEILKHIHAFHQFIPFTKGVIPFRGTVFFTSIIFFFLFMTVKVLESRRWRYES